MFFGILRLWILLHLGNGSLGRWEGERIALLKLKDSFNYPNGSALSSWGDKEEKDCCKWERVSCSESTKRATKLFLSSTRPLELRIVDFPLETSLFLPFEELQELRLDSNGITVMECRKLTTLRGLEMLDLGYNDISGDMPLSIGALTSLKSLSLRNNEVNGSFPGEGLCDLRSLQELDISRNSLKGSIPPCISNLTSLSLLELSENNLGGTIPSDLLRLKSLEYLSLSLYYCKGSISLSSFAKNSNLEVLELDSLNNELHVDTENTPWKPLFQLKVLRLSNCKINEPIRSIPSFLLTQHELRVVNLSYNAMIGEVPTWLLNNNTRLEFLSLAENSFTGQFVLPANSKNLDLFWLDMSKNDIQGPLQASIGHISKTHEYGWITYRSFRSYEYQSILGVNQYVEAGFYSADVAEEIEFISKSRSESYTGNILYFMSGIDLSMNNWQVQFLLNLGS